VLHPEFFKNSECEYGADEMLELKALAEQTVDECIIR
jgi:hypothetical protein